MLMFYNYLEFLSEIYRNTFRMTELQLDCALDLMRRLPPQQIEKNLSDLIDLVSFFISYF